MMIPSPGRFDPFRPTHAIERAALQITFNVQQPKARLNYDWRLLRNKLGQSLPAFNFEPLGRVAFTDGQAIPAAMMAANFAFIAPDGQAQKVLRVDPNNITYMATNYTNWNDFQSEALAAIELAAAECFYTEGYWVTEVGLQYDNRFIWSGDDVDFDPCLLLRPGSPWISPRTYATRLNWHCHYGEFQKVDNRARRLVRMQAAAIAADGVTTDGRSIALTISLSDALNVPGFDQSEVLGQADSEAWVREKLENLHTAEKKIVAEIILDEMQERITLKAEKDA